MTKQPRFFRIAVGDKIKCTKPDCAVSGEIGVIIKLHQHSPPVGVTALFPDTKKTAGLIKRDGEDGIRYRLETGEFEPIDKTIHIMPAQPSDPRMN